MSSRISKRTVKFAANVEDCAYGRILPTSYRAYCRHFLNALSQSFAYLATYATKGTGRNLDLDLPILMPAAVFGLWI